MDDNTTSPTSSKSNKIKSTRQREVGLAAIVTLIGAILSALGSYLLSETQQKTLVPTYEGYRQDIFSIQQEASSLKAQLDAINQRLNQSANGSVKPENLNITELKMSVNKLDRRMANLEKAILDNPEKAVSLPLLKRDIDNIKATYDNRLTVISESLSGSINQLYTVIGTVTVVIRVGLLGALFAVFSSNKQAAKGD